MSNGISTSIKDARILETLVQDLQAVNLNSAEERCQRISGVYAKNMGYLLLALEHLTCFNIPRAKALLLSIHAPQSVEQAFAAKRSLEKIIRLVDAHVRDGSSNLIFSRWTENLIREEFSTYDPLLRRAVANSMKQMNAKITIPQAPIGLNPALSAGWVGVS